MKSTWAWVIVTLAVGSPCLGESIEEVERKLSERLAAHKTLQFKQKTISHITAGDMDMKIDSEAVVSIARKPENKWASRLEAKTRIARKPKDEPEEKQDTRMLTVCDGKDNYILTETAEVTSALKQKLADDALHPLDLKALFAVQRKDYDLKLLPDERVEQADCYVIELKPRPDGRHDQIATLLSRSITWYDKKTGVSIKAVVYDADGKITATTTVHEVKLDQTIADDQFVFKAPAGVTVMDMDQLAGGQRQPAQEQTQASPPPAQSTDATPAPEQPAPAAGESAGAQSKDESGDKKSDSKSKAVKGLLKGIGR